MSAALLEVMISSFIVGLQESANIACSTLKVEDVTKRAMLSIAPGLTTYCRPLMNGPRLEDSEKYACEALLIMAYTAILATYLEALVGEASEEVRTGMSR